MDIISSIENCDLTERNKQLRENLCATIMQNLGEIKENHQICKSVREAFQTIQLGEQRDENLRWWQEAFSNCKRLWTAIKNKDIERGLTDSIWKSPSR